MEYDASQQIHDEFPSVSPRPRITATPEGNFLHQKIQNLHKSGPVKLAVQATRREGTRVPNEPAAKINAYLGTLANHSLIAQIPKDNPVRAARLSERRKKQIDARIIKPQNIPQSFWETQKRAAREQGHGDIEIDDYLRAEAIRVLQTDQRESLRDWVEYLTDKESNYPTWFKYFAMNGVSKLADYDKDKGEFPHRSRSTTDPFPALNREALAYVYDKIEKHITGGDELDRANFAPLYTEALAEIGFADPELLKEVRGSWVKYLQSDSPVEVRRLSESLKGYGTGWCTAGEGYARSQLSAGDFYVFYSRDKDGVDRVPRVAIRMEGDHVAEVRGIVGASAGMGPAENNRQELEPEMIDTAMAKLQDLPGGQEYQQKAADMKHLTEIDKKIAANPSAQLSPEDISFLYEFDRRIQGFGYDRDPRIAEIRNSRGQLDYPEIKKMLIENLPQQLEVSRQAANTLLEQSGISGEQISVAEMERRFQAKLAEWQANGSLDWCAEQIVEGGGRINLLATPNLLLSYEQIADLAKQFGQGQPYETYIYEQLYKLYSPQELSGPLKGDSKVRLSLMPGGYNPKLSGTAETQRKLLANLRQRLPNLKVPSVLDAVAYWQLLRNGGDALKDSAAFDKTYIRHFDLPEKNLGGWDSLPYSYVNGLGQPRLGNSYADDVDVGRLAVG